MEASVSVIIPCYNCTDTITRAVESVVQQTFKPKELILIDDGSNDNTQEILQDLQIQYGKNWLKIILLELNACPSVARNKGWELATQDYIAFLDADDAWHSQKIEIQYNWMLNHPEVDISGHDCLIILDKHLSPKSLNIRELKTTIPITYKLLSKQQVLFFAPFDTPTVMLKRNLPYRFNETQKYCEDYLLWLQIIFNNHQAVFLDVPLTYLFKIHGQQGLSSHLWQMEKAQLNVYYQLERKKYINKFEVIILYLWSLLKYCKRFIYLKIILPIIKEGRQ